MAIIIKNEYQIDKIKESCKLAKKTLDFLEPHVKSGVSTEHLDALATSFIKEHNAIPAPLNYNGFPKSICTSINEVICHGIPSDETVLKDGDILNIDVTTILDGYYGDTCRMFKIGETSKEANDLIDVTKKCLEIGINECKPNNHFGNIGYQIANYANLKGYSVVYQFSGHGVGLYFHEEPTVMHIATKNSGPLMQPGMVFTIEPMICIGTPMAVILNDGWTAVTKDKKLSAQYEHTVLITNHGVEVLT